MLIKGMQLRDAIISASNNLINQKSKIDALNVFPVPDGDTGTNMSMTIGTGARELALASDNENVSEVMQKAASALLRGARGNSGVILSLIFRGISKGLSGKVSFDGKDFAKALTYGVEAAYKAVMKPTEGTILTVVREASEAAVTAAEENNDPQYVFDVICTQSRKTLEKTPDLLPALKKAGVVDAGGYGLCVIFEGMQSVICNDEIIPLNDSSPAKSVQPGVVVSGDLDFKVVDNAVEYEEDITFTYCTEFIVVRDDSNKDSSSLRAYLESIGDSVVFVDDDEIIKCHVHTDNPGNALQKGLEFGSLINLKIDNMREQFAKKVAAGKAKQKSEQYNSSTFKYVDVDPDVPFGFVAVAAGEGVIQLFKDLGVNNIVTGGQTMNPSTDDILSAVQATPAKTVFVFPNNKNIIMAAEQAIPLADREIIVLPTVSIPQGISAVLAFDESCSAKENRINMQNAAENVCSGSITYAARDSQFEGKSIHKNDILALENGKLLFTENNIEKAVVKLVRNMAKRDDSFVTLIYGEGITEEQAQATASILKEKISSDIEITVVNGSQPVYYYLIAVE